MNNRNLLSKIQSTKTNQKNGGYTLAELIVVVGLFICIIVPVGGIAWGTWALFAANNAKVEVNQRCGTNYSMWDAMTSYDSIKNCSK